MDVPSAGDNLHRLLPAHVHLADPHVVAVLMARQGLDTAHHDIGKLFPQIVGQLHLGAGEGHGLGKFLVGGVDRYKFLEPFTR